MKKIFKQFMALAAISAAVASCVKNEPQTNVPAAGEKICITVNADSELDLDDADVKTVYNPTDKTISWGAVEDESLTVLQRLPDGSFSVVTAPCTAIVDGKASFKAEFDAEEAESYTYYALHPSGRYPYWGSSGAGGYESTNAFPMTIPANQTPTATSFDPNADILYTNLVTTTEQPTSLDFTFKRVVALVKLMFTNLPDGKVTNVSFTTSEWIHGNDHVNLHDGNRTGWLADGGSTITLDYSAIKPATENGKFTAWLCTAPFSISEGKSISVSVTLEDGLVCKKDITVPAGGFQFNQGRIRPVNVAMPAQSYHLEVKPMDCIFLGDGSGVSQTEDAISGLYTWAADGSSQKDGFYFNVNNVPAAGEYSLKVSEHFFGNCIWEYSVNGGSPVPYAVKQENRVYEPEFTVNLNKGNNTINIRPSYSEDLGSPYHTDPALRFFGFTVSSK